MKVNVLRMTFVRNSSSLFALKALVRRDRFGRSTTTIRCKTDQDYQSDFYFDTKVKVRLDEYNREYDLVLIQGY